MATAAAASKQKVRKRWSLPWSSLLFEDTTSPVLATKNSLLSGASQVPRVPLKKLRAALLCRLACAVLATVVLFIVVLIRGGREYHFFGTSESPNHATHTTQETSFGISSASVLSTHSVPRIFLYRMIGNDMPPLQCEGQLYNNLQYTLQYEPKHLPGCRRLWVLNNIVNSTVEKMTLELLLNNGYTMDDILVFRINYTRLASLPEHAWLDAVTELNEVRNHMIEHGIAHGARWVLPLDGNHFFTAEMWGFILAAASRHEAAGKKNLKIPVAKVDGPQSPVWLNGSTLYRDLQPHAPLQWEGHLGFRNDSPHRFHPGLGYGRRCKLEAMDRICGTGLYYEWHEAFRYLGLLELYHPDFTPLRANTGECGCMWEVGRDYRTRPMKESLARACGMSVRLWYFPCDGRGEHGGAVTRNESYAFSLRYTARSILRGKIRAMIEATKAGKRR